MRSLAAAFILALPSVAAAHPGHVHTYGESLWHHLAEPANVAVVVAVLSLALAVTLTRSASGDRLVRRRR